MREKERYKKLEKKQNKKKQIESHKLLEMKRKLHDKLCWLKREKLLK